MNRYTLTADSRTWWCPSAAAGVFGAAAVALVALSTPVAVAMPVETTRSEAPASLLPFSGGVERPCFIVQPHWNTALDGPQPVCGVDPAGRSDGAAAQGAKDAANAQADPPPVRVIRVGLDYLP